MGCRGFCHKFKAPSNGMANGGRGRYATGQKRCATCDLFITIKGNVCPCCGCRVRIRSHFKRKRERQIGRIGRLFVELTPELLAKSR